MTVLLLWVALSALSAPAHAGELLGRVTNTLGQPLENIGVSIVPTGASKDQTEKAHPSQPSLVRRTDKHGRFRFVRIQPGKYFVQAKPRANRRSRLYYSETEVQIDYPANAEAHSVEISLRSVRTYKVTGWVLGLEELPQRQLVIFFKPQAYRGDAEPPFSRMAAFVDTRGRFEIYVPRGGYELRMGSVARGRFEEISSTPGTLDISRDYEGLLLDRFGLLTDP